MPIKKLAVAAAGDKTVLASVKKAVELGIIEPVLVGDVEKIMAESRKIDFEPGEIIPATSERETAEKTIELIVEGKADYPMKGLLSSKVMLQALLKKEYGLRRDKLLCVVTLINLEKEDKMVIMSDGGMVIAPGIKEKVEIIENSVDMANALGIKNPKVAVLAAVEKVNPAMPATMEAAALAKMSDRGQLNGIIVDGPFAFDNAISEEAAEHKGVTGPVAGKADILLVPDIEAGNILYKAIVLYMGLESGSLVMGAGVPLVFTSRADSEETKFNSIVLGKLVV